MAPSLARARAPSFRRMRRFARREFVAGCAAAAVGSVLLHPTAAVAREPAAALAWSPLGDDLFLITGAGCNVVAAPGPEGALLIDASYLRSPAVAWHPCCGRIVWENDDS